MRKLIDFLYRSRALILLFVLEFFCFRLVVNSHRYQEAQFLNSSNAVAASFLEFSRTTDDYFGLRQTNEELALENARLRRQLTELRQAVPPVIRDSSSTPPFEFLTAKVIDNTTGQSRNFITINKGAADSIAPGMAVIGQSGIVGKVKAVSENFSVITSLLNIDEYVSVQIRRTGNFATLHWDGADGAYAKLMYLPRHASIWAGDTVLTSGYNAIFPANLPVGIVRKVDLPPSAVFYEVTLELSQDFSRLQFVDVIRSKNVREIDSLQQSIRKP